MMTVIDHISTQVLAVLMAYKEERIRLVRTMPDATPEAIDYVIADPHGTHEWAESLAKLEPGFRPSEAPGNHAFLDENGKRKEQKVRQTYWDLPVTAGHEDSGSPHWKVGVAYRRTADMEADPAWTARPGNQPHRLHATAEDQYPQPEGLDGLVGYEAVRAEYRREAGGPPINQRARDMASVLGLEVQPLVKYVQAVCARVPSKDRDSNREWNQAELEQEIWAHLWKGRGKARGNWEMAKLIVQGAYKDWYKTYSNHRQLGVEAVVRAMKAEIKAGKTAQKNSRFPGHKVAVTSLEEAYAGWGNGESPEAVGFDLKDLDWHGWEDTVETGSGAWWAMVALPDNLRDIIERKANGSPITPTERKGLTRFLAGGPTKTKPSILTNKQVLANIVAGTHLGPIRWSKPQR
jgi:hypothetical protein